MVRSRLVVGCIVGLASLASVPATPSTGAVRRPGGYGRLPLRFEANQGQTDSQVRFVARGSGYGLFLTPDEAVLTLHEPAAGMGASASSTAVVRMKIAGANRTPSVVGLDPLPGASSYLIGRDRNNWRTGVPSYARVSYRGIAPGVDLVYHGREGALEYDLVVAPGADPARIALDFEGADALEIDHSGALVLHTAAGTLVQRPPLVYQDGKSGRRVVSASYERRGAHRIGFKLGRYDRGKPLVIDPVLEYATYLGGSLEDQGRGIAVDAAGSAYLTGFTASLDFPTANPHQPANGGGDYDVFVLKLDPTGTSVVYSTYLGGSGSDGAQAVAVDAAGAAYVVGSAASADFPVVGAFQPALRGSYNAFVAKLSADGSALVYSSYLGGSVSDNANGVAVDAAGNAYVSGWTSSPDFPTVNPFQPAYGGGFDDAFVAKVSADGSALVYSTYLGGSDRDHGRGIAVDAAGSAYVAGGTISPDFPTKNALQPAFHGVRDAFITKLDPTGAALVYSTYLGGSNDDIPLGIAIDAAGNAYVAGGTSSPDFPTTPGVAQPAFAGGSFDAFVAKLSAPGDALVYSTYLGGFGGDVAWGLAVDPTGAVNVTGPTLSPNFPLAHELKSTLGGPSDAFVARLSPSGAFLRFSTYLGGGAEDWGQAIAADAAGGVYVTGKTSSPEFPATVGAVQPAFAGGAFDAFVAKLFEGTAPASANLSLENSDSPDPVMVLSDVSYTLTVHNQGPDTATGVVVTDPLPVGMGFVSASPSQGSCSGTSTVLCSLGSIASGQSAQVVIVARPDRTGILANTTKVAGAEDDPDPADNTATAQTTVKAPSLYPGPDDATVINLFLQYAAPLQAVTLLPFRAKSYDVTIYYGKIDPATFRASLNGVPFAGFVPVPGTFQKVRIPLAPYPAVTVLVLEVQGAGSFLLHGFKDTDTLSFRYGFLF